MKLFIQIPCHNEEATLPSVIASLPRRIKGISEIYVLVIDDGSTDRTFEIARDLGVDYIVRNGRNLGLAKTFSKGLEACLHFGADIVVNIDGDNQHRGKDIRKVVRPILQKRANLVLGRRNFSDRTQFTWLKAQLERLGGRILSHLAETEVLDPACGLRALDRAAAISTMTINSFSYTLEMVIHAGQSGLKVTTEPIGLNQAVRESRLFKSKRSFIAKQAKVMVATYILHRPMRFFMYLALAAFAAAGIAAIRMGTLLWLVESDKSQYPPLTGLILMFSILMMLAFVMAGVTGTVLSALRTMMHDIRSRIRGIELNSGILPLDCEVVVADTFFRWQTATDETEGASEAAPAAEPE
ncbi:MAG: glycosyltransferase family 2 protein, partial [Planctomycetota bacterium]